VTFNLGKRGVSDSGLPPTASGRATKRQPIGEHEQVDMDMSGISPTDDGSAILLDIKAQFDADRLHMQEIKQAVELLYTHMDNHWSSQRDQHTRLEELSTVDAQIGRSLAGLRNDVQQEMATVRDAIQKVEIGVQQPTAELRKSQERAWDALVKLQTEAQAASIRDADLVGYIRDLDAARPVEGRTVIDVFSRLAHDMVALKSDLVKTEARCLNPEQFRDLHQMYDDIQTLVTRNATHDLELESARIDSLERL
jgi:hypothetical protein